VCVCVWTKAVSDTAQSRYTHSALEMCSENVIPSYITHTHTQSDSSAPSTWKLKVLCVYVCFLTFVCVICFD